MANQPPPVATPHEDLLGPALRLAAERGVLMTQDAVALVGARGLDVEGLSRKVGRRTTAFQVVDAAFQSLRAAGLVSSEQPFCWQITPEGQTAAESAPSEMTFDDLRKFPSYAAYWAKLDRDNHRRRFLELRFDYYASARLIHFSGSHFAAGVLFGYSIEYHLKAALGEIDERHTQPLKNLIELSHNLDALYQACRAHGLLGSCYISRDFMRFAGDHFQRRYPRGESQLMAKMGYWSFGGSELQTYDDCITQLDRALAEVYQAEGYRMGVYALGDTPQFSRLAHAFFHNNIFALEDLPEYGRELERKGSRNVAHCPIGSHLDFFVRDGFPHPGYTYEKCRELLSWNLAAFFRYPKKGEPNPDPVRLLRSPARELAALGIQSSKWVVDRMIREFGFGAVDVSKDRETGKVILTVFHRQARKWHRSLELRSDAMGIYHMDRSNELMIDNWVAESKCQFKKLRRNFQNPPDQK